MKKITFLALLSILTLSAISQNKFGHINAQEILLLMPEYKAAGTELEKFTKMLETQLSTMNAEYQQLVEDYQAKETTHTDEIKQDKILEIADKEKRIQAFQQNAQQSLQTKEQELLIPINTTLKDAITAVAKEGGYTYIFANEVLHYKDENNDASSLVKKKLGL